MLENKEEEKYCTSKIEEAMNFEYYRVLFDPVRSEIMIYLGTRGESNISQVAQHFPQDRTVISRHLSLMARYGIVSRRKKAREYLYSLNAKEVIEQFDHTLKSLKALAQ